MFPIVSQPHDSSDIVRMTPYATKFATIAFIAGSASAVDTCAPSVQKPPRSVELGGWCRLQNGSNGDMIPVQQK